MTTDRGFYGAVLLRGDLSAFYLVYTQGLSDVERSHDRTVTWESIRGRTNRVREASFILQDHGFMLDGLVDLRVDDELRACHEAVTVAHRLYDGQSPPSSDDLMQCLTVLLRVYSTHVSDGLLTTRQAREESRMRSWSPDDQALQVVSPAQMEGLDPTMDVTGEREPGGAGGAPLPAAGVPGMRASSTHASDGLPGTGPAGEESRIRGRSPDDQAPGEASPAQTDGPDPTMDATGERESGSAGGTLLAAMGVLGMRASSCSEQREARCPYCSALDRGRVFAQFGIVFAAEPAEQASEGHIVILPMRHVTRRSKLTAEEKGDTRELLRILKARMRRADRSVRGFNVVVHEALQTSEDPGDHHVQTHLIPLR